MSIYSLEGCWQAKLDNGTTGTVMLPGTLDEYGLGEKDLGLNQWHPDIQLGRGDEDFDGTAPIATRFTRRCRYEGGVSFSRTLDFCPKAGERVFLEVERARKLRLELDGQEIPAYQAGTLSTAYIFELSGRLNGRHRLSLISDNSYPGWPHDDIVYSSAATDETQTNWNGVLGYIRLRTERAVCIDALRVYPEGECLRVCVTLDAADEAAGRPVNLQLESEVLSESYSHSLVLSPGKNELCLTDLALRRGLACWDEYEGVLYQMTAVLTESAGEKMLHAVTESSAESRGCEKARPVAESRGCDKAEPISGAGSCDKAESMVEATLCAKTVRFGLREFGDDGQGHLALNGRRIFLRSEANCAVFPETGYSPTDTAQWREILGRYAAYGVNCVRFHSHCPPEAAFSAADELGMLMQPELSCWNPNTAFESEESYRYYQLELSAIILQLANHPSFVMLTLGNELHAGELGHGRMSELLAMARVLDPTRLYACGSNVHYGKLGCDAESDFYTSQKYYERPLRGSFAASSERGLGIEGHINQQYPGSCVNYNETMAALRQRYQKPVFSFEVGQFEVLPDFDELSAFAGVTEPVNYRLIRDKVERRGLMPEWKRRVEASGELSSLAYREEVEAVLRTEDLSGISLLGLQDFPGQGTALVGMLNAHLQPKTFDFARPERFHAFFRSQLPLAVFSRYTYEGGERFEARLCMANYGKESLEGELYYRISTAPVGRVHAGEAQADKARADRAHEDRAYEDSVHADKVYADEACVGEVSGEGCWTEQCLTEGRLAACSCPAGALSYLGNIEFELPRVAKPVKLELTIQLGEAVNHYPLWLYKGEQPLCPPEVYETLRLDERAEAVLRAGGRVYLSPNADKSSLPFSIQCQFTTDFWSVGTFAAQEGGMGQLIDEAHPLFEHFPTEFHTNWQWWPMAGSRAIIYPRQVKAIVAELDSYAFLRPMAQLAEFNCGGGKLLISSMGLQNLQYCPEARALLSAIYRYMGSEHFIPRQSIGVEEVRRLVK